MMKKRFFYATNALLSGAILMSNTYKLIAATPERILNKLKQKLERNGNQVTHSWLDCRRKIITIKGQTLYGYAGGLTIKHHNQLSSYTFWLIPSKHQVFLSLQESKKWDK